MRLIYNDEDSLVTPAYDAETDWCIPDCWLTIPLGAHFDPARNGIQPMVITVPIVRPISLEREPNPSDTTVARYVFDFRAKRHVGIETLCVIVSAEGGAPPFRDLPLTDENGLMLFNVCRRFADECRRRAIEARR